MQGGSGSRDKMSPICHAELVSACLASTRVEAGILNVLGLFVDRMVLKIYDEDPETDADPGSSPEDTSSGLQSEHHKTAF